MTRTKTEDRELLKYAGLMGHTFVGISGQPGERRIECQTSNHESAFRLCTGAERIVYTRAGGRTKGRWLPCLEQ